MIILDSGAEEVMESIMALLKEAGDTALITKDQLVSVCKSRLFIIIHILQLQFISRGTTGLFFEIRGPICEIIL